MNFNKKVKGFFISSLTALVAVCGVAFGVTYKNAAVKAADGLSDDVQAIIDGINLNGQTQAITAEYVENAVVANAGGATVSGIRVTYGSNTDAQQNVTAFFDGNGLSASDKIAGYVFDTAVTGSNSMYTGFGDVHGTKYYMLNGSHDGDSAENPQSWLTLRYYSPLSSYQHKYGTAFAPYHKTSGVGSSSSANIVASRGAYTATSFNVYYDNGKNVLLCDKKGETDSGVLLLYNVSPSDYNKYTHPVTGETLVSSSKTGVDKVEGFDYNRMQFVTRTIDATGNSYVLTSFAGLDLTNKAAAYTAENAPIQLVDYESQLGVNSVIIDDVYNIPAAHLASRITNAKVADFTGTVNVYSGKRSSTAAEYGSYGYAYATAEQELGAPIKTGLTAGAEYAFPAAGNYTLEYVQGDKKLYVDVAAVKLSEDVKAIVAAINGSVNEYNASSGSVSAEYVSNYNYNGVKLSGIKVTVSGASDALYLPMLVKISDLTYNDNTLGYFMTPAVQGTNDIGGFHAYLVSADKNRAIAVEHGLDSDNKDTASSPRTSTHIRVFENGLGNGRYFGLYNDSNTGYPFGTRGIRGVSLNGYAKVPFNISYDASLNAMFGDINASTGHPTGNTTRFMRAFGVSPSDYPNYVDPTTGKNLKVNGSTNYSAFTGLGEYAYIGFRPLLKSGVESASFVITSYAGVDLTNPSATADNVISALKAKNVYADALDKEVNVPEIKTENRITSAPATDVFDGTVTVYKGVRDDKYVKYGSWGAESLAFPVAGGEAVNGLTYLGVAENGVYTFTESGNYTLVYASSSGETEIKEVYVSANTYTLKINAFNAKLTDEDGNLLETGATVYSGQTVKVVPNEGYTLLNVGTLTSAGILIGDKANADMSGAYGNYRVLSNGSYVIQESDESTVDVGVIDIGIAAYKTKYNVKFYKNKPEDATEGAAGARDFAVYKDVPAGYTVDGRLYCVYNPTVFKPTSGVACWYNNFGWDGNVLSLGNYNWSGEYNAASGDAYAKPQLFGYKVTYGAGSAQTSAIYKLGGNYQPTVDSDVSVEAAYLRSFVEYSTAKIETSGTIGLSVKLGISKPDYDRLVRMLGGETAFDMNAVITTGTVLDELGAGRKNAYHVTRDNPSGCVQAAINRTAVATETYNGKEYYVYTVKGVNIPKENYAKDYVFGGYLSYNCPNGGQVVRFGQGGAEFEKINVYKAACTTFGEGGGNVTTDTVLTNSCEINGLTYYSDTLDERGIYFAVKYYYVGMYLTYVTETETEGYTKYELNGKTYYYDQTAVNSVDIIRAIKFYNGVSLAKEV